MIHLFNWGCGPKEAPISKFYVKGLKTEPLTSGGKDVIGRMKGIFAEPESATKEVLATQ